MYKIFFNEVLYKEFNNYRDAKAHMQALERSNTSEVFEQYRLEIPEDEEWAWQDSGIEQF